MCRGLGGLGFVINPLHVSSPASHWWKLSRQYVPGCWSLMDTYCCLPLRSARVEVTGTYLTLIHAVSGMVNTGAISSGFRERISGWRDHLDNVDLIPAPVHYWITAGRSIFNWWSVVEVRITELCSSLCVYGMSSSEGHWTDRELLNTGCIYFDWDILWHGQRIILVRYLLPEVVLTLQWQDD